jgi:PAS domain S-box-containing protein
MLSAGPTVRRATLLKGRRIRTIRLLLVGASLVVGGIVAVVGWMIWDARRATWEHAVHSSQNVAFVLEHDIARNVELYDLSLRAVIEGLHLPELHVLDAKIRNHILFDHASTAQHLGSILVIDENGEIAIDSRSPEPRSAYLGDRDYFTIHRENADFGLFVSRPFKSRLSDEWSIALSRRIDRPDGTFGGVVVGTLRLSFFRELFHHVDAGPDGAMSLMSSYGSIVYRTPFNVGDLNRDLSDSALFRHFPLEKTGVFQQLGKVDGIERLYVFRQVAGLPLVLVFARSTAEVFAEWRRKALIIAGAATGLIALAALLGCVLVRELRRRSRAERAARDSERRFRLLADNSTDLILRTSLAGDRLYVSPAVREIYGYDPGEVIGTNSVDSAHPEDRDRLTEALARMREGSPYESVTMRARHRDGSYRWIEAHMSRAEDRETDEAEIVVIVRDISARKETESALAKARDAAEAANRAKSEFLASMSHELRTPLNAVIGFSQLLLADRRDPVGARHREFVGHIETSGNRLLALINDLLDLAKIEANRVDIDIQPVVAIEILDEAASALAPAAREKQVMLEVASDSAPLGCSADRDRLLQVLSNLGSNAIKYNRPGGSVVFRAELRREGVVRLVVADTGIGIPSERSAEVFQPFNRLGAERSGIEGTGIGLSICRTLVERMGGRIGFESEHGVGSRFWVDLPDAVVHATPSSNDAGETVEAPAPSALTLVYVEDNALSRELMIQVVSALPGVRLFTASTGAEGISLAELHRPDLLVVDVNLPDFDGYEVLRRVRASSLVADVPVMALSADAMPADLERAETAGFWRYLTKPVDLRELLAAFEDASGRRCPTNPSLAGRPDSAASAGERRVATFG